MEPDPKYWGSTYPKERLKAGAAFWEAVRWLGSIPALAATTAAEDPTVGAGFDEFVEIPHTGAVADGGEDDDDDEADGKVARHGAAPEEGNGVFAWGSDVLEVNEGLEGRDGPAVSSYRFPEEIVDHDEYGLNGRAGGRRDMGLEVGDVLLVDYMGRDGCLDLSAKTGLVWVAGRQTVRSPDSTNCLE